MSLGCTIILLLLYYILLLFILGGRVHGYPFLVQWYTIMEAFSYYPSICFYMNNNLVVNMWVINYLIDKAKSTYPPPKKKLCKLSHCY